MLVGLNPKIAYRTNPTSTDGTVVSWEGWAHNACEAPAGDLCAHASWALSSPAQSNQPTNNQNVRDKGNPIEKCAGQRKSYRKMCGAKEIILKNVRDKGNPIEKCAGQRKSY